MAKKKQEQQEQSQDEHVMAILDKRTNKTAVVSKMNEQDGSLEIVPPDKKNSSSFLKLDRTSAGTILHQFQEPVRKSHEFQFLPRTSCPFGKDTECRSPNPKRGRPRSGR